MSTLPKRLILGEAGDWQTPYTGVNTMNVDHDQEEFIAAGWEARTYDGLYWYKHTDKLEVLAWLKNRGYEDSGDGTHFVLGENAMLDSGVEAGLRTGTYNVFSMYDKETVCFTALGLLELHDWVEEYREQIETEAKARREELKKERES